MAKKQKWAEMDKSKTPLSKLVEGFALYNRDDEQVAANGELVHRAVGVGTALLRGQRQP